MKRISHIGFTITMLGMLAVGLVAFSVLGFFVDRDITQLSVATPQVTVPQQGGRVAGVSVEPIGQASVIIDDKSGAEPLQVDFPVTPGMTVYDIMQRVTQAFDLNYEVAQGPLGYLTKTIGSATNGTNDSYWQYAINDRTPVEPINTRVIHPGDVIRFTFVQQKGQ